MGHILFYTNKGSSLATEEVVKLFEDSEDIQIIRDGVEKAADRLYVTWATVEMKDKAGEIIPMERMVSDAETYLNRGGLIMDNHSNRHVGKTLAYKIMEHPVSKTMGMLHLSQIFQDNLQDDKVWSEIQTGKRKGSSVGGFNTSKEIVNDPMTHQTAVSLSGFNHNETSSVFEPCNPLALNEAFSVVAKSATHNSIYHGGNLPDSKKKEGDLSMGETNKLDEILKAVTSVSEDVKKQGERLSVIEKADEDRKEDEEKKKAAHAAKADEDAKEEEDKRALDEEQKKKEDAASDIDGSADAKQPKEAKPEDNNELGVFKAEMEQMKKEFASQLSEVKKSMTPRPNAGYLAQVEKARQKSALAMDIINGKKKLSWAQVNKAAKEDSWGTL